MNNIIIDTWLLTITVSAYKDEDKKVKEDSLIMQTVRYEKDDIIHDSIVVNNVKSSINQMYIQNTINDILPEIEPFAIGAMVHFKEIFVNILKDCVYDNLSCIVSKYGLSIVYRLFDTLINDILLKCDYDASCIEIKPIHILDKEFMDKYGIDLIIQADLKRDAEKPIILLDHDILNIPVNIIKDKN